MSEQPESVFNRALRDGQPVRCTEKDYYYALGVLPPHQYLKKGFVMGEQYDHWRWYCFWCFDNQYWCWLTDLTSADSVLWIDENGIGYDPSKCKER